MKKKKRKRKKKKKKKEETLAIRTHTIVTSQAGEDIPTRYHQQARAERLATSCAE